MDALRNALLDYTRARDSAAYALALEKLREVGHDLRDASEQDSRECFAFNASPPKAVLSLPELPNSCFSASAFSIWVWVRLEESPASAANQLICSFDGPSTAIDMIVVSRVVSLRVTTSKGGCVALQARAPLAARRWHLLMFEHVAPTRRMLSFSRAGSAGGTARLYIDGALELEGPLDFPTPTSSLRRCHVGSRANPTHSAQEHDQVLQGQIAELVQLPTQTGADAAAEAASLLRLEPRMTLHEAAMRCGLKPSVALHPQAFSLMNAAAIDTAQLGAVASNAPSAPAELGILVERPSDVRVAIASVGGVSVPLLLIGRLQLPPRASAFDDDVPASLPDPDGGGDLAELLSILNETLRRRPFMYAQYHRQDGGALLAWLLLKAPPQQLTVGVVERLEELIDGVHAMLELVVPPLERSLALVERSTSRRTRGDGSPASSSAASVAAAVALAAPLTVDSASTLRELHARLEMCCLCDFRIWARASVEVQLAHLRNLQRRVARATASTAPTAPPPARAAGGASPWAGASESGRAAAAATADGGDGAPLRKVLSVRHVLDALRTLYSRAACSRLSAGEFVAVRREIAALAATLEPTADDVSAILTRLAEIRDPAPRIALLQMLSCWLARGGDTDHGGVSESDGGADEATESGGGGGASMRSSGSSWSLTRLKRSNSDSDAEPTRRRAASNGGGGSDVPGACQLTLDGIDHAGGVACLMAQLTPPMADLREAALAAIGAYLRCNPPSITAEVEERLVALLTVTWLKSERGAFMSDGVCAALLRIACAAAEPTRLLQRSRIPHVLVSSLPECSAACRCAALQSLLVLVEGAGGAGSATVLLSDPVNAVHLVDCARRLCDAPPRNEGSVGAALGVCTNFGEVYVSLVLGTARASSPSPPTTPNERAADRRAAQLALRILARLLRHALDLADGWYLLPLLHALLDERHAPAVTSHALLTLCCRALGSLEAPLLSGELPPFEGAQPTDVSGATSQREGPAAAELPTSRRPGPFWANLAHFLHCLDQLLLRSHAVWLAGGAVGHGDAGIGIGALGPSALTLGDELLSAGAAHHLIGALVCFAHSLSHPLRTKDRPPSPPPPVPPPHAASSSSSMAERQRRSPLNHLSADVSTFRMVLQWLVSAIQAGWQGGARALDASPLALPVQLLLQLAAPLYLPHASATLVLASLVSLGAQRPGVATPLLTRLIYARGPTGNTWEELLPGCSAISTRSPRSSAAPSPDRRPPPAPEADPSPSPSPSAAAAADPTSSAGADTTPPPSRRESFSGGDGALEFRRYLQTEAAQCAHGEVRDSQAAAARAWATAVREDLDGMRSQLREREMEAQLLQPSPSRPPASPTSPPMATSSSPVSVSMIGAAAMW